MNGVDKADIEVVLVEMLVIVQKVQLEGTPNVFGISAGQLLALKWRIFELAEMLGLDIHARYVKPE